MNQELKDKMGEVRIADEVISTVAGLAATDVAGVVALSGGISREEIATANVKNLQKSIKISVEHDTVNVKAAIIVKSDVSIPKVSKAVQEKIADAIESMIGLRVGIINVTVTGVVA